MPRTAAAVLALVCAASGELVGLCQGPAKPALSGDFPASRARRQRL